MADAALITHTLPDLAALWDQAPQIAEKHLRAAMEEALLFLQREVQEATPTGAHQLLRKSITAEPVQRLASGLLGVVDVKQGSALDYAVAVELGTKPHMPPIAPLVDWAKAKLGLDPDEAEAAAHGIAWKIFHQGTKGAHMFEATYRKHEARVFDRFDRAAVAIAAELGG